MTQREISRRFHHTLKTLEVVSCNLCGAPTEISYFDSKKEKYFCSRSCANTRNHSVETRKKISLGVKDHNRKYGYKPNTSNTSNISNNPRFTSKGEVEIREFFIESFPKDFWTFGGSLSIGGERIVRDLYSNTLKVCIEYDGIWHFKDIHGQLEKKQLKDLLLEIWCISHGFRLIRIKDRLYKSDKDFWRNRLIEEVYQGNSQTKKFYNSERGKNVPIN